MKWLSNMYDPESIMAQFHVMRAADQTHEEAWQMYLEWLKGKYIGAPKATKVYTVAELIKMNMVGVYAAPTIKRHLYDADGLISAKAVGVLLMLLLACVWLLSLL